MARGCCHLRLEGHREKLVWPMGPGVTEGTADMGTPPKEDREGSDTLAFPFVLPSPSTSASHWAPWSEGR